MIVNHRHFHRLKRLQDWFYNQASLHPHDRARLRNHYYHEFEQLNKYMLRTIKMAKKQKDSKSPTFVFKGYVNIGITEKQTPEFLSYLKDHDRVWNDYAQVLVDGYAVKATFDGEEASYRVSLTGFANTGDNFGYVIGGFADDWFTALAVVLFKHYYVAKENWQDYADTPTRKFG